VAFTPILTRLARLALRGLRTGLFVYIALLIVLLFLENRIIYPAPRYPEGDWTASYLPHEDVFFESADGTQLHGWLVEHPRPRAVVLYCHGNGNALGDLGAYLYQLHHNHELTIFAFDYRGYGKSEGSPSEAGILADGDAAQKWLAERLNVSADEIVLMGRSLGGAVAIDLAFRNGARGLILQNTFTSLPAAAARIYPWAPVNLLMRNRYESLSKIAHYRGPLLISHGEQDTLVPYDHGRALFDAAPGGPKTFIDLGGGHNDDESPEYYLTLDRFLAELPPAAGAGGGAVP
jgi:uncharacterized protein